ncbi:hypothetical protein GVAV_003533 [Gurleya vavrai]
MQIPIDVIKKIGFRLQNLLFFNAAHFLWTLNHLKVSLASDTTNLVIQRGKPCNNELVSENLHHKSPMSSNIANQKEFPIAKRKTKINKRKKLASEIKKKAPHSKKNKKSVGENNAKDRSNKFLIKENKKINELKNLKQKYNLNGIESNFYALEEIDIKNFMINLFLTANNDLKDHVEIDKDESKQDKYITNNVKGNIKNLKKRKRSHNSDQKSNLISKKLHTTVACEIDHFSTSFSSSKTTTSVANNDFDSNHIKIKTKWISSYNKLIEMNYLNQNQTGLNLQLINNETKNKIQFSEIQNFSIEFNKPVEINGIVYNQKLAKLKKLVSYLDHEILKEGYEYYLKKNQLILDKKNTVKDNGHGIDENNFLSDIKHKKLDIKTESLQNIDNCKRFIVKTIIDNQEVYNNDIDIKNMPNGLFFEKSYLHNIGLRFYYFVNKILKLPIDDTLGLQNFEKNIYIEHRLNIENLLNQASNIPCNSISNTEKNWNRIHDYLCLVFTKENSTIKKFFSELIFFQSYPYKEKFFDITTKQTFSIEQIAFFLYFFHILIEFDWESKFKKIFEKAIQFSKFDKIGKKNKKNNQNFKFNNKSENMKKCFFHAYVTSYSVLSIILHPFLNKKDHKGFVRIISALKSKCKGIFLGLFSNSYYESGIVISPFNLNLLKNIMFMYPAIYQIKNVTNNNTNLKIDLNEKIKLKGFSILSMASNFNYHKHMNFSSMILKCSRFDIYMIILHYYINFQQLLKLKVLTDMSLFNNFFVLVSCFILKFNQTLDETIKKNLMDEFKNVLISQVIHLQEICDFTYIKNVC